MERRKEEIRSSSKKLQIECDAITDMLAIILDKNSRSVTFIEGLSNTQILAKSKDFLNISQFQHNALQKVLEISLELEVFLSEMTDSNVNAIPIDVSTTTPTMSTIKTEIKLEGSESQNQQETTNITPKILMLTCDGTCNAKKEEIKITRTEETEGIDANEDKTLNFIHNVETTTADIIEQDIELFDKLTDETKDDENVPERDDDIREMKFVENTEEKFDDGQEKIVVPNDCQNISSEAAPNNESAVNRDAADKNIKSENSDYPNDSDKDTNNKKTSSTDSGDEKLDAKPEQVQTIHEKLKSKKLLSRKDRYLQSLPKPNVPDLSFKPSTKIIDVFDHFQSCRDSSSSSSGASQENKKRRKRSESATIKEEKIETLKVPHLSLQESPVPYQGMCSVVSHMQSPSEIYINVADDNIALIDCLSLQISDLYESTSCPFENKADAKEKLGKYCVAYIEEYKIWYRAEVLNWHLKGKSYLADIVTVQLVDYGHINDLSYKNLRRLIVDFCHLPKCAIKCHLAALYPPTSTPDNLLEVWPVESLRIFQDLFYDVNQTVYKVIYVDDMKHSWAIDLLSEKEKDENLSIGQQLIDAGAAEEIIHDPTQVFKNKFCISQLQTAQGLHGISATMCEEQKLERYFNNDRVKEPSNLDEAMVNYRATDEARTCRFALPNGTCFKGSKCKLDHQPLRKDGITTDKQSMFKSAFNELILPRTGDHIFLQVTNVISINTFYACQVERMNNASYSAGLIRLLKLMNKEDTVQKYKHLKMIPTRGEIVIVKSWNSTWYRGQVQEVFDATNKNQEIIQVFIVDFGELIDVTMNDLRQIISDYLHLPFQAIMCHLYNVSPTRGTDEVAAKEYFESNFLCQCFKAKVMYSSSSILQVVLTKCDGEDVGQQIIDDELGEPRTEFFFPQETEVLLVD